MTSRFKVPTPTQDTESDDQGTMELFMEKAKANYDQGLRRSAGLRACPMQNLDILTPDDVESICCLEVRMDDETVFI